MQSNYVPLFLFLAVGAVSLFSFLAVLIWVASRQKEREAFYRSETIKKLAEKEGSSANSALEFIREQERNADRRRREGIKIGGLVNVAAGIGLMVFLIGLAGNKPAYFVGFIPLFVGLALLTYAYVLAPKE